MLRCGAHAIPRLGGGLLACLIPQPFELRFGQGLQGAPVPAAEPEGATALGLDNLRIAVQASLDDAPPAPPPSGWEDVGDDKVLAALRSLEAMGFVDSLGADACLARVQMHMMSSGAVDLDAAVADLVSLMKGSA